MSKESFIYPITIAQVQWQIDDLRDAFRIAGIEPTKDQMNKLVVDEDLMGFLQNLLKVAGTHVLADMIAEIYNSEATMPAPVSLN
jgi:hypothetical protein